MKKKALILGLSAMAAIALILFAVITHQNDYGHSSGDPETVCPAVQVLEKASDSESSSYEVGADLIGTDFSDLGALLTDQLTREWNTYDGLTREQIMVSSHLWGVVSLQTDTWEECEEAVGFSVDNPLENLDWLNKTGYFGAESVLPELPAEHIQITANSALGAAQENDRKLREITITSGYNQSNAKVTLTATLCADTGPFTTQSGCDGYATFEEETTSTQSGIPVLIVTTDEANNNGYYQADFFDTTAYWVKGNVFYTLRVFGDEADKSEIRRTLDRILQEI